MAVSSMRDIRNRIHSVENTRQITKAMELVAVSKMSRSKQRKENSSQFFEILRETVNEISTSYPDKCSLYVKGNAKLPALFVIIGGDRGLAGGYNSNVLRLAAEKSAEIKAEVGQDVFYLPVGKKMTEHFAKSGRIIDGGCDKVETAHTGECRYMGRIIVDGFNKGKFGSVYLIYTRFISMLSQEACIEQILPLTAKVEASDEAKSKIRRVPVFEPGPAELLSAVMPQYISGMLYGAVCESVASECAARRTAMDSATKNADAMLESLSLQYNRARQAAITQEITEIVSGAGSL